MREPEDKVGTLLNSLYKKYGKSFLLTDPVHIVHRYSSRKDIEVVALITALMAFGKASQIARAIEDLLSRMGSRPADFLRQYHTGKKRLLRGFRHRYVGEDQVVVLFSVLSELLSRWGSIENMLSLCICPGDLPGSLSRFTGVMKTIAGGKSDSLKFLLPDPGAGSACKRLFLFLRWMVRENDGIDFGMYTVLTPGELIIPLDTHIARLATLFGFTGRKSKNLSMAIEITERLRRYDPDDPVKYDFALTRVGIAFGCRGVYAAGICSVCEARVLCRASGAEKD